jgi:DNA (cytosine-5)-methyltransferase 1
VDDMALQQLRELALFAGAGGGILGGLLLGWRTRVAVEIDPYCRSVLLARQRDGILEPFPIWDEIKTFDGYPWRGRVDVVSGGFPCVDISTAGGANRKGLDGEKSGLWTEMARIIREVQPRFAFVENSPAITFRGLGRVLGDLAEMGFDARWGVFSAGDIGARHQRERMWIIAANRDTDSLPEIEISGVYGWEGSKPIRDLSAWISSEPRLGGKHYGVDQWMDRLKAIGNGQVPAVVRLAWEILQGRIDNA